jgi:RNA polymerase sigma-70 factor (ECF subfamily)
MMNFDSVYAQTKERVWGLCTRLVPPGESSEDAFQEIFLLVFRYLPGFRGEASVATWCHRIALNYLMRMRNRHSRQPLHVVTDDVIVRPATEIPAEALGRALAALDPETRELITMVMICGVPQQEVADKLRVPIGTVHSRLSRAKAQLREEIMRYDL